MRVFFCFNFAFLEKGILKHVCMLMRMIHKRKILVMQTRGVITGAKYVSPIFGMKELKNIICVFPSCYLKMRLSLQHFVNDPKDKCGCTTV